MNIIRASTPLQLAARNLLDLNTLRPSPLYAAMQRNGLTIQGIFHTFSREGWRRSFTPWHVSREYFNRYQTGFGNERWLHS